MALEPGEDGPAAASAWRTELEKLLRAVGWADGAGEPVTRPFPGGLCFALPSRIDLLYTATELNEWAIESATRLLSGQPGRDLEQAREDFSARLQRDARPALVALHEAARARNVPFLWDDDLVTLGMAGRSRSFPLDDLPSPDDIPWDGLGRIPVVLLTGTNGKTTSARLIAAIAREAGYVVGNTSTDGIAIDGEIVDGGDWTGAEAARRLLRRPEVQLAVLETARGGILRRGLAIDRADAALITNVTADHLGEFGVHDVETMARVKAVVAHAVEPPGRVVLNGDDERLVALMDEVRAEVILFGLDAESAALRRHRAEGRTAFFARDGELIRAVGSEEARLVHVQEIPITFGGAASHNVANALAAAAIAFSMGLDDEAVRRGLRRFGAGANPGRGQFTTLANGVRILTDFGHNAAALRALFDFARTLVTADSRLFVASTQAGDRDEGLLAAQAAEIARAAPTAAWLWETPHLLRGRAPGEVTRVLERELRAGGVRQVSASETEVAALDAALAAARPGDLIVIAPNIDRAGVAARLRGR